MIFYEKNPDNVKLNFTISESTQSALSEIIDTASRPIPTTYIPVIYQHNTIGALAPQCFKFIKEFIDEEQTELFFIQAHQTSLQVLNSSSQDLSIELRILAEHLRSKNMMSHWRNENFSFLRDDQHEIFQLERAAFRTFGFLSQAVHVNGFTQDGHIWLAKRSDTKSVDPGLMDNITAGGVSASESIQSTVIRELWEEAGIISSQLKNLFPIGTIEIHRPLPPNEIHHEKIFTFDLLVEDDWTPTNQDGEVYFFKKYQLDEVIELLMSDQLTKDAAVVTADFILRYSLSQ